MAENPSKIETGAEGRNRPVEDTSITQSSPQAAPNAPGRDARGRYLVGHTETITNAQHTDRLPLALEYIRREVERFNAAQLADEGGNEIDIPARRRSRLQYRAVVHRKILALDAALERGGLFDRRGKLRSMWLQRLESLINVALRLDAALAPDRRPKDAMDLQTWIERGSQQGASDATDPK